MLHPDRLLPAEPAVRSIARDILSRTQELPIVSPHGHVPARSFADDTPIGDPAIELVTRDHYLLRMLYSQGVPLEQLGVGAEHPDGRAIWRTLAEHFRLFLGTPSKVWLDYTLAEVVGADVALGPDSADCVVRPPLRHARS